MYWCSVLIWIFTIMITPHGSKECPRWSQHYFVCPYITGDSLRSRVHLQAQSLTSILSQIIVVQGLKYSLHWLLDQMTSIFWHSSDLIQLVMYKRALVDRICISTTILESISQKKIWLKTLNNFEKPWISLWAGAGKQAEVFVMFSCQVIVSWYTCSEPSLLIPLWSRV